MEGNIHRAIGIITCVKESNKLYDANLSKLLEKALELLEAHLAWLEDNKK